MSHSVRSSRSEHAAADPVSAPRVGCPQTRTGPYNVFSQPSAVSFPYLSTTPNDRRYVSVTATFACPGLLHLVDVPGGLVEPHGESMAKVMDGVPAWIRPAPCVRGQTDRSRMGAETSMRYPSCGVSCSTDQ